MGHEQGQRIDQRAVRPRIAYIMQKDTRIFLTDLDFIRVIGRGGFGVVKMVQARRTGMRYALKCVRKRTIVEAEIQDTLKAELSIVSELDFPFIYKFVKPFRSRTTLYFLFELVTGGELLDALNVLKCLSHVEAQFYTVSIVLALEFLHSRQIAYLDLKSDNCLIDDQGYLKLIDFGIAQRMTPGMRLYLMTGAEWIRAPEMILGRGYTTVADLWSLGVCLYEFMAGRFPFGVDADGMPLQNVEHVLRDVVGAQLRFPPWWNQMKNSQESRQLVEELLTRDPSVRIGAGFGGYAAIRSHPFFTVNNFNFDALLGRELKPPHMPKGEVYGDDRPGPEGTKPAETPARVQPLKQEEEETANESDDEWQDPEPGWDHDFDRDRKLV